jgi:hypothetical protein
MPHPEVPPDEPRDWMSVVDEEVAALPEKYRSAVVLCDLQGLPRKESARLLGIPEGTLSARLARARRRLAAGLSLRGMGRPGAALAAVLAGGMATAAVPEPLVAAVAKAARLEALVAGALAPPPSWSFAEATERLVGNNLSMTRAAAEVASVVTVKDVWLKFFVPIVTGAMLLGVILTVVALIAYPRGKELPPPAEKAPALPQAWPPAGTAPMLIAKRPIPANARLTVDHVWLVHRPKEQVPDARDLVRDVAGRVTRVAIGEGEPITEDKLDPDPSPRDK